MAKNGGKGFMMEEGGGKPKAGKKATAKKAPAKKTPAKKGAKK